MTPDAQILRALRTAKTGSVSGTDLSQRLGISRAAIWARIEELRSLDYDIQAGPQLGYRLISSPDRLHADDLLSRLDTPRIVGRDIRVFQETSSTNDVLEKFARDGVKEGVVVLAESQTKGRGRLGRKWFSQSAKGLWFSVLLRPDLRPVAATQLTAATAVALAEAIRQKTSLQPDIKWPNDLLLGGRKIAGILTELSAELDHIKHLILGIGLNVNQDSGDFPPDIRRTATSLRLASNTVWDRADIAVAIFVELDRIYDRIKKQQFGAIAEEYERQCLTLGHRVIIQIGNRTVQGRAESLDADGALLVRTQHGRLERILGGDVALEKSS
jgi:BirA family biotin operon repressor/biotin-[acetyl-CoA-carboxylase] ligase